MRVRPLICALVLLSALLLPLPGAAQLKSLETERLRLVYIDPLQTFLTPHAARCFESSMDFQRELFGYEPSEPVTVILADPSDYGGARAGVLPRNNLSINIAPLSFAFETMPPGERMTTIMNHELVHVVSMDQAAHSDLAFRRLFRGKVMPVPDHPETILYTYLTTPRLTVPSWYQEGTAVFMETWMAGGLGRAQGAYDEMVFRSMVRDGTRFYDPLGLVSEGTKVDFQAGINAYLYGTRFVSYLAHEYSPESVVRWVARTGGSRKYYASQFRAVYGLPLDEAWRDWVDWEHEFQRGNLETIRRFPTTPYVDLSDRALGSVSRAFLDADSGRIYAAFNYPGVVAHIGAISLRDGAVERLVDVKDPVIYTVTSLAHDADGGTLFYTTDNSAQRDLRALDLATGKTRRLLKDARIGDLVFDPTRRALWGLRQFNGIVTLVRIDEPYGEWKVVHSWPYGEVAYDIDVSPDGKLLSTSFAEIDGRHTLRVLDLEQVAGGRTEPVATVDFASVVPSSFVFSDDGRYLYGSSYYTGVSNIFRYELATGELEAVSNSETGFFRPIPAEDGSLIVFRYTGEGFVAARIPGEPLDDVGAITFLGQQIAERHPEVRSWIAASPASVPLDDLTRRDGDYRSVRTLGLETIYPVIEGYKDSVAAGLSAQFSDPMFLNRFTATASYSPDDELPSDERLHLRLDYERRNWTAGATYNAADFYDLFGPTKTSRKGYSVRAGHNRTLIHDLPRKLDLNAGVAFHGDLERLPDYQNVAATFDRLWTADLGLRYSNQRASIGAVDWEKGLQAELLTSSSYVNGEWIPGLLGNFDVGLPLPLDNSSVWLRTSAGAAFGELQDPFANFFFGGYGNNWVDHGSIKRYHAYYSFPGLGLNEAGGRNYAKALVEWNLPPLRFERLGSPGFYLTWARTSLFAGALHTNLDVGAAERKLVDAGVQVDLRFTVLHKLDMTLSLGYAVAGEEGFAPRDEFMASLKILR